jgi:5-formyltetrahydrofolate cyclo-ligase
VAGPGRLTWHAVHGPDELQAGSYGIREPDPARAPAGSLPAGTLLLVPGTGFTSDGHRLGQGGGFYDRLLAAPTSLVAVGVGFTCQLRAQLPLAPHDRPLAGLVIAGSLVRDPRQA